MIITHPNELQWQDGPLPDVHAADKRSFILVWVANEYDELHNIIVGMPYEDESNPLRWCESSRMPLWQPIKYWAWIKNEV